MTEAEKTQPGTKDAVLDYKAILQAVLDNGPSGTRQRLAIRSVSTACRRMREHGRWR